MTSLVAYTLTDCGTVTLADGREYPIRQINVKSQLVLEDLSRRAEDMSPAEKADALLVVVRQVTGAPADVVEALHLEAVNDIIGKASAPLLAAQAKLAEGAEGNGAAGATAPASGGTPS